MAFPVTLNGRTYTLADFAGQNYVDGMPDAFEDFVTQAGNTYVTTSTSTVSFATGAATFTVAETGKPYQEGTPLRISVQGTPTDYLNTVVTSYSGTTLNVTVVSFNGSGSASAWNINIGGDLSIDGTSPPVPISLGGTGATTQADAQTALFPGVDDDSTQRFLTLQRDATSLIHEASFTTGTVGSSPTEVRIRSFTTSDDLDTLLPGSSQGAVIEGGWQAHLVLGIRENDANDGVYIVSGGAGAGTAYADDQTYDTVVAAFKADGKTGIGTGSPLSTLDVSSARNTTLTLTSSTSDSGYSGQYYGKVDFNSLDGSGAGSGVPRASIGAISPTAAGAAADLTFSTGSAAAPTERMRIDSLGNVGIGTSSPLNVGSSYTGLTLNNPSVGGGFVSLQSNETETCRWLTTNSLTRFGTTTSIPLEFATGGTNAADVKMTLDTSGNVGIGVTDPDAQLEIQSGLVDSDVLNLRGFNADRGLSVSIRNESSVTDALVDFNNELSNGRFSWSLGGSEKMRIDSDGDVGIGTTNPATILDIEEAKPVLRMVATDTTGTTIGNKGAKVLLESNSATAGNGGEIVWTGLGDANTERWAAISGSIVANGVDGCSGSIQFSTKENAADTSMNEVMRITNEGRVGIGTPTPSVPLHVSDVPNSEGIRITAEQNTFINYLMFGDQNGGAQGRVGYDHSVDDMIFYTNGANERMRISDAGDITIGSNNTSKSTGAGVKFAQNSGTASQFNVAVVGDGGAADTGYSLYDTGAAAYRFYVDYNGSIFATNTSITAISDASLKENVRDIDCGLDQVMQLRPRRFDWIDQSDADVMGFVAQEVEPVMPELVVDYQYTDNTTKKALKMGDMVPALVKAIQEQQAMIDELRSEVAALKAAKG